MNVLDCEVGPEPGAEVKTFELNWNIKLGLWNKWIVVDCEVRHNVKIMSTIKDWLTLYTIRRMIEIHS